MRLAALFVAWTMALWGVSTNAQNRDGTAVLSDVRQALGGATTLDAVKAFTVSGTLKQTIGTFTKSDSIQLFALLPDHFMEVRRDFRTSGPMQIDVTYYSGYRGDQLIRRVDANIPFPPDPFPAASERAVVLDHKRRFARLALVLFGASLPDFPLQITYAGQEQQDGRALEVLDLNSATGPAMRFLVDAATHLPAFVEWQAEKPVMMTTTMSSTVATRGGQVVSQSPPVQGGQITSAAGQIVTWRLVPSRFEMRDGVNWPRRIQITSGGKTDMELSFDRFKINPKLDTRRFDVGR